MKEKRIRQGMDGVELVEHNLRIRMVQQDDHILIQFVRAVAAEQAPQINPNATQFVTCRCGVALIVTNLRFNSRRAAEFQLLVNSFMNGVFHQRNLILN